MNRTVATTIIAAAFIAAAPYALAGRWVGAFVCLVVGIGWLGGARRGLGWPAAAGFLLLVGAAALGALSGLPPGWGLAGVVAALAAWDLSGFQQRLAAAGRVVDEPALWRAHLRLLAAVAGLGLALGTAALLVRTELSFGWALLLGLIAAIALARAVASLKD
ncbi:MAG TPA: hypothetical protein VNL77_06180 [Roseiflexaceae bacterium]|nr:hypothetical protein [Roseiflexaceae bacterium]